MCVFLKRIISKQCHAFKRFTRWLYYCWTGSLVGQDQPEQRLVRHVKLVTDSLTSWQIVQRTHSASECLCHHQVVPVHVKDLPGPFVDTVACQLLSTNWAGYPNLPQVIGHPYHQLMGKEVVGRQCLVVDEGRVRGLVPQLQIWP